MIGGYTIQEHSSEAETSEALKANQILNMVIRMLTRRVVRGGVNMGINAASKQMSKSKGQAPDAASAQPAVQKNPQQAQTTIRMKKSMRAMRRVGRF